MSELKIQSHDFEDAKKSIKNFSESTKTDLDLKRVSDKKEIGEWLGDAIFGGGIGFEHKVTGKEINELTVQIQKHLHSVNDTQIKIIREFGHVYNALEALDKDYINAIMISLEATGETSEAIKVAQEKIKKVVEDQIKTIEVLKKFKQKLDTYSHLSDIDRLWGECQKWNKEIEAISDMAANALSVGDSNVEKIDELQENLKSFIIMIEKLDKCLESQIFQMEKVAEFVNDLKEISHLQDVDKMWDSLKEAEDSLNDICKKIELMDDVIKQHQKDIGSNKRVIDELVEYKKNLSLIKHLGDVDKLWEINEDNVVCIAEIKKQESEMEYVIQNNKEHTETVLEEIREQNNSAMVSLTNKIKYSYLIAGSSLGLALIEMIIILLKVI